MKILPVVNAQNNISSKQAMQSPAFCAAPESKAINSILRSPKAQWVFKFASKNQFGFNILALALSCIIMRPATIMVLPGQKKDDKQYLAAKSIIASVIIDIARFAFCLPLARALVKNGLKAKQHPDKIKFPAEGTKEFNAFKFATNNGLSIVLQIGTAALMTMAIPKVMAKILPPPEQKKADCERRLKGKTALLPETPFNASNQAAVAEIKTKNGGVI